LQDIDWIHLIHNRFWQSALVVTAITFWADKRLLPYQ